MGGMLVLFLVILGVIALYALALYIFDSVSPFFINVGNIITNIYECIMYFITIGLHIALIGLIFLIIKYILLAIKHGTIGWYLKKCLVNVVVALPSIVLTILCFGADDNMSLISFVSLLISLWIIFIQSKDDYYVTKGIMKILYGLCTINIVVFLFITLFGGSYTIVTYFQNITETRKYGDLGLGYIIMVLIVAIIVGIQYFLLNILEKNNMKQKMDS